LSRSALPAILAGAADGGAGSHASDMKTPTLRGASRWPRWLRAAAAAVAILALSDCSLISVKTPEKPLSPRDLNARILTHEYSGRFIAGIAEAADEIASTSGGKSARIDTLRWKIASSVASENSATQMAPFVGLIDTWALSAQMADFLSQGAGRDLFGAQQSIAIARVNDLTTEAEALVRRLSSPAEFERARITVNRYVREYPFTSLAFARPSIAELWAQESSAKVALVDAVGTVPEALTNLGDVVRLYGATGSSQLIWSAQLAGAESGLDPKDIEAALRRLDERIAQLAKLAETTPQRFDGLVAEWRTGLGSSLAELHRSIHTEETDFFAALNAQREATVAAVDAQRVAAAADVSKIAEQVLRTAGEEVRGVVRVTLLFASLLALIVLGLPFAAGYWVGRARSRT